MCQNPAINGCAFRETVERNRLVRRRQRELPRSQAEARLVVSIGSESALSSVGPRGGGPAGGTGVTPSVAGLVAMG